MKAINILITSVGRRTELLKYFKKELEGIGKLIAADCSAIVPALYIADRHYIVPRIDDENYINTLKDICKEEKVTAVLSLIDPELSLLARHAEEFEAIGVKVVVSSYEVCKLCLDKYEMYEFLRENNINCAKTYLSISDFEAARKRGEIDFPVFVKPRRGSASIGIRQIWDMEELRYAFNRYKDLIIQEFLKGEECGADVYIDLNSKEVTSIFTKRKLVMRAGETDKAVSFKCAELFGIIENFVLKLQAVGSIDIDVFKVGEKYYISEVNPRFGGGYPLAYECGCMFPKYIVNNLMGETNQKQIGLYKDEIYMVKHDSVMTLDKIS